MADPRLIPDGIKDESTLAWNEVLDRYSELDLSKLLVYLVENSDEATLEHLGSQFHILGYEGWLLAKNKEEKANLVKNSKKLHIYKGTKHALNEVLKTLNLQGKIQQYFEYSGIPYHFKVLIDVLDRGIDEETLIRLDNLVEEYKNERSILDGITVFLTNKSAVPSINTTILSGEEITVYPWNISEISASGGVYFGIGTQSVESVTVYPQ